MIATDNLDLGCTIFEKAATEKAIREIDERLIQQYNNRVKAKGSNQPFYDQSQLHGRFPLHLPDSLKPKPGHLNPAQQRVYEDFARIPRGAAGAHAAVGGGKPMASMEKVLTLPCPRNSRFDCQICSNYNNLQLRTGHLTRVWHDVPNSPAKVPGICHLAGTGNVKHTLPSLPHPSALCFMLVQLLT